MIYIVGVPRAGKSTLAWMLNSVFPKVSIISSEAMSNAFSHILPDIASDVKTNQKTKDTIIQFLAEFAEWNEVLTEQKSIIDVGLVPIETIHAVMKENDHLVCLGFGGKMTKQQIWDLITQNHEEYDYTYGMDLDRVIKLWGDFAKRDAENKFYCDEHKLTYLDTSKNRDKILLEEVKKLAKYLNE